LKMRGMRMKTLLQIESSPLDEQSLSTELTRAYSARWQEMNPGGRVIKRDLCNMEIPVLSSGWIAAVYTPGELRNSEQIEVLKLSDEFIAELKAADEYVLGVPMHNFGIPSSLKLWIDQIVRVGETFAYGESGPAGLLTEKKVTVIVSSGGIYESGSPLAWMDCVEPYLRTVLGFIGMSDQTYIRAGNAKVIRLGNITREDFLAPHLTTISRLIATA
jgi:FMN-dependent NADH-azoreductase